MVTTMTPTTLALNEQLQALVQQHGAKAVQDTLQTVLETQQQEGGGEEEEEEASIVTATTATTTTTASENEEHHHRGRDEDEEDPSNESSSRHSRPHQRGHHKRHHHSRSNHHHGSSKEERLNRSILDCSPDAIVVADEAGNLIQVNKATTEMFGFATEADAIGKNFEVLLFGEEEDKDDDTDRRSYVKNFLERGKTTTGKHSAVLGKRRRLMAKRQDDNSEFPVRISLRVVPGATKRFVGFIQDVTSETKAEREEQLNKSILDSSPDAIFVANRSNGNILQVNQAMIDIFGFENQAQALESNIEALVDRPPAPQQPDSAEDSATGERKHRFSCVKQLKKRSGKSTVVLGKNRRLMAKRRRDGSEFPVRLSICKVGGTQQKGLVVGFIQDITHETRAMELAVEKRSAEDLLFNMLPPEIAQRLTSDPSHIADHFPQATILFADICGFTRLSNTLQPIEVVQFLNSIFSRFDEKLDQYGLNKVKTIGDCYMVTSIPHCQDPQKSCAAVCHFAMDMIRALQEYNDDNPDTPLSMRIGVNCGPVVAGVVGTKRFLYDVWGDAVNVASRMESTGLPGKVQVTQAVIDAIPPQEFAHEKRGSVQVKGIGEMETFFITEQQNDNADRAKGYWKMLRSNVLEKNDADMNDNDVPRKRPSMFELLQTLQQLEASGSDLSSSETISTQYTSDGDDDEDEEGREDQEEAAALDEVAA